MRPSSNYSKVSVFFILKGFFVVLAHVLSTRRQQATGMFML
jgi:hypothetical protein